MTSSQIAGLKLGETTAIVNQRTLNAVRHLNKLFEAINEKLPIGGRFTGVLETAEQRKARILGSHPGRIAWVRHALDYLVHRVLPKLPVTKRFYFLLTGGRVRVVAKAEVLGRLVCCGFKIVDYMETGGILEFTAEKVRAPAFDRNPSYGPLLRMRRVGRHGRIIRVYKLRTMHPYAEYLQAYLYERNSLERSGKFSGDFRVTTAGRVFRRLWIDELPMLINWLKRDLKLVGVRPLTEHYLSLYPESLRELRLRHKPGLIPPFYADLPAGFDAILASEKRYLEAYECHPWRTDIAYLSRSLFNILVRGARSN